MLVKWALENMGKIEKILTACIIIGTYQNLSSLHSMAWHHKRISFESNDRSCVKTSPITTFKLFSTKLTISMCDGFKLFEFLSLTDMMSEQSRLVTVPADAQSLHSIRPLVGTDSISATRIIVTHILSTFLLLFIVYIMFVSPEDAI